MPETMAASESSRCSFVFATTRAGSGRVAAPAICAARPVISAESEYICVTPTELPEAQATEVMELIDKLEQDDDVQKVYHTLA